MNNSIIEEMATKALNDVYFITLFNYLEKAFFIKMLYKEKTLKFSKKQLADLLTFADILSLSENEANRNISIKIISLLNEFEKNNPRYDYYAKGIMLRLGNFPSYNLISKNTNVKRESEPFDIFLERIIKEEINKSPYSNNIFTDSQLKVYSSLKDEDYFSFSGPTSFGKSFILSSFISYILNSSLSKINIAFVVPTRALISQNIKDLKRVIKNHKDYILFQSPDIPECFKNKNFIFVFTPERLAEYLSDETNPSIEYVFIDEAHKVLSEDSRSAIYYHALNMAEKNNCKLFFSSPNIPNSDVFLTVFEKPTDKKLYIEESPVTQNRCLIDIVNKKIHYFSFINESIEIEYNLPDKLEDVIKKISLENNKIRKSIIYCNTIELTIKSALNFAKECDEKNNENINNAIEIIKEYVHEYYYLIDCIKKGVAFHFGKLPQRIRSLIENLYKNGDIDYLFCTSTLLEGVNLPAQNIFILSNKIGNAKLTSVDFWNLAGRAGRLAKDLYGDVFCIRYDHSNMFRATEKDLKLLQNKQIENINAPIISGKSNFYKNIRSSLLNEPFTSASASENRKKLWNSFANILMLQKINESDSLLKNTFINKIEDSEELLNDIKNRVTLPAKILSKSLLIKWKYQEDLYNDNNLPIMSQPSYENCLKILEVFYDKYNWAIEEAYGKHPLINLKHNNPKAVLKHYAFLMAEWMDGTTINLLIKKRVDNHRGKKIKIDYRRSEEFDPNNREHVNILINNTMEEIDNILRFKIKNYCENYVNILKAKGVENVENWALYLEHGSKNPKYIELQKIGIPRHLVEVFYKKNVQYLVFDNNTLKEADFVKIRMNLEKCKDKDAVELLEVLDEYNL